MVEYELSNDPISRIPKNILNDSCKIINSFDIDERNDVTISTCTSKSKERSFLNLSTLLSGETISESRLESDYVAPNSMTNMKYESGQLFLSRMNHNLMCIL